MMRIPGHRKFFIAGFLLAAALCPTSFQSQAFESNALCRAVDNVSFVRKVAIIGADDRQTLADYAKERGLDPKKTEAAFAATGIINCDGRWTSAQLTGRNDVLTTAAHNFLAKDCTKIRRKLCHFVVMIGGIEKEFPLALETLKVGDCASEFDRDNDWAIVKLIRPVEGIRPYPIVDPSRPIKTYDEIIQVSGSHRNFQRGGAHPKTIQHCQIRNKTSYWTHDCDTGGWSSGSGQFIRGSNGWHLASINVAESHDSRLHEGADYNATDDSKPHHYNLSVPLAGDFLAALKLYIGE